ncbi:MAG TPA: 6-bladed beta-propeller [Longimicrobium sp.]|nr:6-bladed beta-propeller [Longimicrobium sp.]
MVRKRRVWTAARMGAALALAACARGEAADAPVKAPQLALPGWSLAPAARVGGAAAGEQEQLFNVTSVAEDAQGRFYVANAGDKRVLVFDSTGAYVRTIGRGGSGPGEFTAPRAVAPVGADGLMVLDLATGRLSRFRRSDGMFLGDVSLPGDAGMPYDMRATPSGVVAVEFRPPPRTGVQSPAYLARVDTATGAVDRAGAVTLDTVARAQVRTEQKRGRSSVTLDLPFAPRPVWDVEADGSILFGTGARYEVSRARGGQRSVAFHGTGEPRAVTGRDRDGFFASSPATEQFRGKVELPRTHPYFTGLRAGPNGLLWVRLPGHTGEHWEVRDAAGTVQGVLDLPKGSRLMLVSSGAVYVLSRDEEDVETVDRLALRR